ncbi:hypothetical protein GcC1_205011 [Golovinomyces cichoracearum]|uniref:Uncharacterized protein n=1 Tax=Golovinomyces cichoracearum TaxID=62708 RepID=A0A420HD00_9PEZI|nr:hypothetical protein GcC1_205011 [Golovinomyces cichoracearum]
MGKICLGFVALTNVKKKGYKANRGETGFTERIKLCESLNEQQRKRQALVQLYPDMRSMTDGIETSIFYAKNLLKTLSPVVALVRIVTS